MAHLEIRLDGKILCNIKDGWNARIWGSQIILTHQNFKAVSVDIDSVRKGDVLPRATDKAIEL